MSVLLGLLLLLACGGCALLWWRNRCTTRVLDRMLEEILDGEPTGNLDSRTTVDVMGVLSASSRSYKQTILMVTHNEALAQSCDRIIHIEDGRIVAAKGGEQS